MEETTLLVSRASSGCASPTLSRLSRRGGHEADGGVGSSNGGSLGLR
jgi:hypothetical protein